MTDQLDELAARWRSPDRFVPGFDPDSGRTLARVLVLLESPARTTVAHGSIAISSEDNPNPSSRGFRRARIDAGLTRQDYLRWNIIPWVDTTTGDTSATAAGSAELDEARDALHDLLLVLPHLTSIVTLGQPALTGIMRYFTMHPEPVIRPVLAAPHPSPANGRYRNEQHTRMVAALSRALQC